MKIVEQMKQTGAHLRKIWVEVPEEMNKSKAMRTQEVEKIIIEIIRDDLSILLFNGDEQSQERMHRSYTVMKDMNLATVPWRMEDGKTFEVTSGELLEALYKSGMEQSALWFA